MAVNYENIREENIREYGEGTRHLAFLGTLYTDRTHFIFELLQNAEDAGATCVCFHLFRNRLEVFHNGRLFDEGDIRGICGVGQGTKAQDLARIGKFGIGFKSVYAYTVSPEIHSGEEHFKIEHYVRPFSVNPKEINEPWTTSFIFPFDATKIKPEAACEEIGDRLRNLESETLLFLRKIEIIEYRLHDLSRGSVKRNTQHLDERVRQIRIIKESNAKNIETKWIVFERKIAKAHNEKNVHVEAAFQISTKSNKDYIVKVNSSPCVVFFPTEKETRLGFLIQGPYRTTPSRDNILPRDEWNQHLVEETALLLKEALLKIREFNLLSVSFLESMPMQMERFSKDNIFHPIAFSIMETLQTESLLPTADGSFVSARNAKLVRGAELRKLLHENISALFPTTNPQCLTDAITHDKTPELYSYLLKHLEIEEISAESFARKLNGTFLATQSDEWIVNYYSFLLEQESLWRAPRSPGDTGGFLRTKEFIRLEDSTHKAPFLADGSTLNVFLPSLHEKSDFPVVKREIASNPKAGLFLKRLGLDEPKIHDDIISKIFPKYINNKNAYTNHSEHINDIKKILSAMNSEKSRRSIIERAPFISFLKAVNGKGERSYRKPREIYLKTPNMERYFSNLPTVFFLDEELLADTGPEIWIDLGVAKLPRRKPSISASLPAQVEEDLAKGHKAMNYELEGLDHFLNTLSKTNSFEEREERAFALWSCLKEHLELDPYFFKGEYQSYRHQRTRFFDSHILERLRNGEWIPTKQGSMRKPSDITTENILEAFLEAKELLRSLGIRPSPHNADAPQAEADMLPPEKIALLRKHPEEFERFINTLEARDYLPEFPSRPLTDDKRRHERFAAAYRDAPSKEYVNRERSVRTTRGLVEPEKWLRYQYTNSSGQMICQICKEEMPFRKRNGEYYFEAVEAFSRHSFTKEHEAQFLALCPLCAAQYKEFIKNDENAAKRLMNALLEAKAPEVSVEFGDLNTSIRFVETHSHDLKNILNRTEVS